jgi:hypothetical protein
LITKRHGEQERRGVPAHGCVIGTNPAESAARLWRISFVPAIPSAGSAARLLLVLRVLRDPQAAVRRRRPAETVDVRVSPLENFYSTTRGGFDGRQLERVEPAQVS